MDKSDFVMIYRNVAGEDPVCLSYREERLRKAQARFHGRTALIPQIDLNAYQCRAVVDWIDIHVELTTTTQHQWINDIAKKVLGRKVWIKPQAPGPGNTSNLFQIRMQEPDFRNVRKLVEQIKVSKGLASRPTINGLELSIDFRPNNPDVQARGLMHGVLTRHLCPPAGTRVVDHDWPGFFPGGKPGRNYIIGRNFDDDSLDLWGRLRPEMDRPALYGSTFYVGRKEHPRWSWRVQDKVIDQQNIDAGTHIELPDEEKRTRIEVTIGPAGCRELGLTDLAVLETYRFTRLQSLLFKFMVPTFGHSEIANRPAQLAVRKKIVTYKKHRFLNSGIIGLQIMDEARQELRRDYLRDISRRHRLAGTRMPSLSRTGNGAAGHLLAYDKLNRRVEQAFRHLQERVWGEMVR